MPHVSGVTTFFWFCFYVLDSLSVGITLVPRLQTTSILPNLNFLSSSVSSVRAHAAFLLLPDFRFPAHPLWAVWGKASHLVLTLYVELSFYTLSLDIQIISFSWTFMPWFGTRISLLTSFTMWIKLYPSGISLYITCSTYVFSLPPSSQGVAWSVTVLPFWPYLVIALA